MGALVAALVVVSGAAAAQAAPSGAPGAVAAGVSSEVAGLPGATAAAPTMGGGYHALPAKRLLDTRNGTGGATGLRTPGSTTALTVLGRHGVPSSGVAAVMLTVVATGSSGQGYVTSFPSGASVPTASTLNWTAGETVSNASLVKVGADGKVALRVSGTATHLVADVVGYVESVAGTPVSGALSALAPSRILDTRSGVGAPKAPARGGRVLGLAVAGRGGVPSSGAGAVVLNLTVADSTAGGHVTASPTDTGAVSTSTLNYATGQTVANLVTVGLGPDGGVDLRVTSPGTVRLVADVVGWVAAGAPTAPLGASPVTPARLLDTRATGGGGPVAGGTRRSVPVAGRAGVPAEGAGTALLNVTVADATFTGHVQVVAKGQGLPVASTLNFQKGRTKASFVAAAVAADGAVDLAVSSGGSVRLVVDVVGYVLGPPGDTTPPSPVTGLTATPSGPGKVTLSWSPPAGDDATGVVIRRLAGDQAPTSPTSGQLVAGVALPVTTFTDSGRAPGVTYSYAAFAHDTVPNSAATGPAATATTEAITWSGGSTVSSFYGRPDDVSCPTTTWCMAVGEYGHSWIWSGGAWSAADTVTSAEVGDLQFRAVSCPTTTFCLAALFNNAIATWRNGEWTVTATPRSYGDVSCWSSSGCGLTVGWGGSPGPEFERWTNGTINGAVSIAGRSGAWSLSCPTSTCHFLTGASGSIYVHRVIGTTVTTKWVGKHFQGELSCASATWCMTVVDGKYRTGSGTTWSATRDAATEFGQSLFATMDLSCPTTTSCTVVGVNGLHTDGGALRWNGNTWSLRDLGDGLNTERALDCASSSTCLVVDDRGRFNRWTGSSWTTRTTFAASRGGFASLDCLSATSCLATDWYGNLLEWTGTGAWPRSYLSEGQSFVDCAGATCMTIDLGEWTWRARTNGTWTATSDDQRTPAAEPLCVRTSLCFSVAGSGYRTWNGRTWDVEDRALPLDISAVEEGADCPTSTFCLAVGSGGRTVSWNGTRWVARSRAPLDADSRPKVDCVSASFCMATFGTRAAVFGPSGWRALPVTEFNVEGTACRSATQCFGMSGNRVAAWDGDRWSLTTMTLGDGRFTPQVACGGTRCVVASGDRIWWTP